MTQPRLVHAVTLMSTHEHLIVMDPKGRHPEFLRRLHRLVSLGTKVLRKWEGPTWEPEQAIIEKLAYVTSNPAKAGLVRHARDWPGITVLPHELGRRVWTAKRLKAYFNANNLQWPDAPSGRHSSSGVLGYAASCCASARSSGLLQSARVELNRDLASHSSPSHPAISRVNVGRVVCARYH